MSGDGDEEDQEPQKRYECHFCSKLFASKNGILYHLQTNHSSDSARICEKCQKPYPSERHLALHLAETHASTSQYECIECEARFKHSRGLRRHVRVHWQPQRYECSMPQCSKRFNFPTDLKRHLNTHKTPEKSFICNFCGAFYKYEKSLQDHIASAHSPSGQKRFSCSHCPKRFHSKMGLYVHRAVHEVPEAAFACPECPKNFLTAQRSRSHLKDVHGERKKAQKGKFDCGQCEKSFGYRSNLMRHLNLHLQSKEYPCRVCGKILFDQTNLKRHEMIHVEGRKNNRKASEEKQPQEEWILLLNIAK